MLRIININTVKYGYKFRVSQSGVMVQKLIVFLILCCTFTKGVGEVESIPEGESDEATILLAGDLDDETRARLQDAISGVNTVNAGSANGNTYLLVPQDATVIILDPQGLTEQEPSCTDVPPDARFSCQQQMQFGQCDADFMLKDNYCAASCNRCVNNGPMEFSMEEECTPLPQLLQNREDTASFRDALEIVDLDVLLDQFYKATVLVPNDDAFFKALQTLGESSPQLTQFSLVKKLIAGHIIPDMKTDLVKGGESLPPLSGQGAWKVQKKGNATIIQGSSLGSARVVPSWWHAS
eukprot:TRINITY_DN8076_c0_g1_i4.p2 TRINITY_DN8076_c0_g1~~TRINITY_DN8076_c0_g1_i4.p2  ORF type:complete len:295 (-),score=56.41 TRINITY_DN8076_c0_g1_i4:39-923(-)